MNLTLTLGLNLVQQGSGLSQNYPDFAVVTKTGKYITSVDGKFVLTLSGFVPINIMRTVSGIPVTTKSGKYITI
jgi:hypothetical protein